MYVPRPGARPLRSTATVSSGPRTTRVIERLGRTWRHEAQVRIGT
jgi:hypothetical protein